MTTALRTPTPPARALAALGIVVDRVTPGNVGDISAQTGTSPGLWLKAQDVYDTWTKSWTHRKTGVEVRSGDVWRTARGALFLVLGMYERRRGVLRSADEIVARGVFLRKGGGTSGGFEFPPGKIAREFVLVERDGMPCGAQAEAS